MAALTDADVTAIDKAILSQLSDRWQKTALVVARAMSAYPGKYEDLPDVFYGQRVVALCSQGLMEADGNLRQFRFGEIRAVARNKTDG